MVYVGYDSCLAGQLQAVLQGQKRVAQMEKDRAVHGDVNGANRVGDRIHVPVDYLGIRAEQPMCKPVGVVKLIDLLPPRGCCEEILQLRKRHEIPIAMLVIERSFL